MRGDGVSRGRGEPYSEEENEAIMAGPPREPTKELQARLHAAGYPLRTIDALKAQKKVLRYKAMGEGPRRQRLPHRAATLGARYEELASELAHLDTRRKDVLTELKEVSLAMVRVGLGLDGAAVPEEVQEALREYVETYVARPDEE